MGKKKKKHQKAAERVAEIDAKVAEAAAPGRGSWPVRLLSFVSDLGDQPPLRALCVTGIIAGIVTRNERLARAGVRALAAHELATATKNAIKHRIDRTRPHAFLADRRNRDGHRPTKGENRSKEETSFPSGHSAGAAAVARAVARDYPELAPYAYGTAGLLALAQIPRCAHYPSDVGAGLALGIAAEAAASAVLPGPAPSG